MDDLPTLTTASQLTLEGIELTAVGASVTGPVDPGELVGALGRLSRSESWTRWAVADLLLALVDHHGDPAPAYQAVAGLGYHQAWLAVSIEVARRVPAVNRHEGLSWGHHEQVARECIDVDDQVRWLEGAFANRWSIRTLTTKIDEWERRDEQPLDGMGGTGRAWKMPPAVVRRVGEIVAMDPQAWVLVHPSTGEVRRFER